MPPSRDEDLDWLYGRQSQPAEPEPTRVIPSADPPPYVPLSRPPGPRPGVSPEPPPGAGSPVPSRRQRRPVRTVLAVVGVLLLASLVWLVGVPAYAWSQVTRVDDAPGGQRPADQPGQTFLIVGSDSREGLSKAEQKALGTGSTAGQRTDTLMLLNIPTTGSPALISLPRDSYVSIPQHGKNKINAAYGLGGSQLLVQTVETNTGLRVDGYLEIGFGGFVNIIDALDGIEMCLPAAIKDKDSHINLKKGCQSLGGTNALGYVRMRKADPRGDLGRVERQRQMLAAVAKKAASPSTVLNPFRYRTVVNASAESVKIGEDTSLLQTLRLGLAMRSIANGDGLTLTVPVSDPGASTSVGSAVIWDEKEAQAMFTEIARGDTSDLKKYTS